MADIASPIVPKFPNPQGRVLGADMIGETAEAKVMTAAERAKLGNLQQGDVAGLVAALTTILEQFGAIPVRDNTSSPYAWNLSDDIGDLAAYISKDGKLTNFAGLLLEAITGGNQIRARGGTEAVQLLINAVKIAGEEIRTAPAGIHRRITDENDFILEELSANGAQTTYKVAGFRFRMLADGTTTIALRDGRQIFSAVPGQDPVFAGVGSSPIVAAAPSFFLPVNKTKGLVGGSSSIERAHALYTAMFNGFGVTDIYLGGDGGARSQHLAAQMGAIPAKVTIDGGQVVAAADTPFNVTVSNVPTDDDMASFYGMYAGVQVRLGCANSQFVFRRRTAGAAIPLTGEHEFIPLIADKYRDAMWILQPGKNDFSDVNDSAANVFARTKAIVAHNATHGNYVLVLGHFVNQDAGNKAEILAYNTLCAAEFGARFFDEQAYLMSPQVWIDTGIQPTSADNAAQLAGTLPPSLAADFQHKNDAAMQAVVNQIAAKITGLGWFA